MANSFVTKEPGSLISNIISLFEEKQHNIEPGNVLELINNIAYYSYFTSNNYLNAVFLESLGLNEVTVDN